MNNKSSIVDTPNVEDIHKPSIKDGLKNDLSFYFSSSLKRLIKLIAILFIPFLYAFTCACAFWNPLKNIGKAPIAIVSLDTPASKSTSVIDETMNNWKNNAVIANGKKFSDFGLTYQNGYFSIKVNDRITLNHIEYFNIDNGANKIANYDSSQKNTDSRGWSITSNKYYMVLAFANDFTDMFEKLPTNPSAINGLIDNYISYQMNFLSCEILDLGASFALGIIMQTLYDDIVGKTLPDINNIVHNDVPNKKYAIYGVGVGELFICIGMWVGGYAIVLGLDRKKRAKGLSPYKWYVQKSIVMYMVSIIQSIILTVALGCLGFFGLGMACFWEWLLIAYGGLVFNTIVQSIWFAFRDQATSLFVMILFMILNVACGFGTFPAFMQFPFFHYLSYIMPFTWINHAQGTILYGLANPANYVGNVLYILMCVGILLLFVVLFYGLGLAQSRHRVREIYYGSWRASFVLESLKELGIEKQYTDNHGKLNWHLLPQRVMIDVVNTTLKNHPYYDHFKNYKKRDHFVEYDQYDQDRFNN
ncbi:MAG: ABC transporter permease [Mycoplasmataceae bacterium]|nr:ABC transporter permease [Mycoplasmataceae bacterium]